MRVAPCELHGARRPVGTCVQKSDPRHHLACVHHIWPRDELAHFHAHATCGPRGFQQRVARTRARGACTTPDRARGMNTMHPCFSDLLGAASEAQVMGRRSGTTAEPTRLGLRCCEMRISPMRIFSEIRIACRRRASIVKLSKRCAIGYRAAASGVRHPAAPMRRETRVGFGGDNGRERGEAREFGNEQERRGATPPLGRRRSIHTRHGRRGRPNDDRRTVHRPAPHA